MQVPCPEPLLHAAQARGDYPMCAAVCPLAAHVGAGRRGRHAGCPAVQGWRAAGAIMGLPTPHPPSASGPNAKVVMLGQAGDSARHHHLTAYSTALLGLLREHQTATARASQGALCQLLVVALAGPQKGLMPLKGLLACACASGHLRHAARCWRSMQAGRKYAVVIKAYVGRASTSVA